MNTTEDRLADALKTVGNTLGPADVPSLDLSAARRRSRFVRPALVGVTVAAAATVAVVAGGVALTQNDDDRPAQPQALPPSPVKVAVILCAKASTNPTCKGKDTTAAVRRDLMADAQALPGVASVSYESRADAFQRFKERFSDTPGYVREYREGDIPDSFVITLKRGGGPTPIRHALIGREGVDQVLVDR